MAKKLALFYPSQHSDLYESALLYSPLALAYVAAYTPSDWKISLHDEYVGTFIDPSKINADLVAISALTPNIPRAYYLADKLRERGIKVAIGGAHVSALPEEALHHVDVVIKGEAEAVWPQVISDFENGTLKPVYDGRMDCSLVDIKLPRREFIHPNYEYPSLITSKGCPFKCNYCYLSVYEKNAYRTLPVDAIIEDMDIVNKTADFAVIFVDENISGYSQKDYENRMELFERMIKKKYNFVWGAQSTVDVYKKPEMLKLMYKAGCRSLFLGLESTKNESLGEQVNKGFANKIDYNEAIKTIHRNKISIIGSFIIGMDNQDKAYAKSLCKELKKMNVEYPRLFYLTAWPGTALYDKMKTEDKLKKGWNRVRKDIPSLVYKHFTAEEIMQVKRDVYDNFFTKPYLLKIVLRWIFKEPSMVLFFLKLLKSNRGSDVKEKQKLQIQKEKYIQQLIEEHFKGTEFDYLLSDYDVSGFNENASIVLTQEHVFK